MKKPAGREPLPRIVDLADIKNLQRWCEHFGVNPEQLIEAVNAAGTEPAAVTEHLLNQGGSAGVG